MPAATDVHLGSTLLAISRLAYQCNDPREALEKVIDLVQGVVGADSAAIELINPDTHLLEIEVVRGMPARAKETQLRLGQGITGWVALHGRSLLVNDVAADPRYVQVKESVRAEMAVPMIERGAIIGVMNLDSNRAGAFGEADLGRLEALAAETARVVGRIWEMQNLAIKADQLESLLAGTHRLVAHPRQEEVFEVLVREALVTSRFRVAALFLREPATDELVLRALSGTAQAGSYEERLKPEDSALGTAIFRRKQVGVLNLAQTEEHHFVPIVQAEGLVSMLASPLIYEEQVLGVLTVYTDRPHRFSNDEKRLLAALAGIGALALQNAHLYSRVFATESMLRRNERLTTLGLLSAEIAHEIRNPLTVIKLLFGGLDLEFPPNDPRARDLTVIAEKIDQLEHLVSRVLSFGKARQGLRVRADLRQLVEDTLHLVRLKLAQSGISLAYHPCAEATLVEGSKGQLQQAFLNLVINAIEAMPQGGAITVTVGQPEGVAEVVVRDTGPGIERELLPRIFESFLSGREEGTGLGLGIVKRIVSSHGGAVEVAETGAGGTAMRVRLPLAS